MFPENLAIGFIQAKDSFAAADRAALEGIGWITRAFRKLAIGHIDPSLRHGRARITTADGRSPKNRRTIVGEFFDDSTFPPNRVAIWAEPLRPIICEEGGSGEYDCGGGDLLDHGKGCYGLALGLSSAREHCIKIPINNYHFTKHWPRMVKERRDGNIRPA